eukprot:Colp12_sorted_trinity150504_noHs@24372
MNQNRPTGPPENPNSDAMINSPPTDGITSLAFSPVANHLIATSWDNQVRCWEIGGDFSSKPLAATSHDGPILDGCWAPEGNKVYTAGCDKQAKEWDLMTNQARQVAAHDAPIKAVKYVAQHKLLLTASWDRTIRYWDLRQSNPVQTVSLSERVFAVDLMPPQGLVVATADRKVHVYDFNQPDKPFKSIDSPLKFQSRCVASFPGQNAYALGSIEGRVAIQYVDDAKSKDNFTFKCHRSDSKVYAVNAISVHPKYFTFSTSGSDGAFNFWDKENKQRIKQFHPCNQSISATCFNATGEIFAYANSYDWHRGHESHNPQTAQNLILLHPVKDNEIQPKPKGVKR